MQQDITTSFNLPLRIAVVETNEETLVLYPANSDFEENYDLQECPVLQAVDKAFATLQSQLTTDKE